MGEDGEMGHREGKHLLPSLITRKGKTISGFGSLLLGGITFRVPSPADGGWALWARNGSISLWYKIHHSHRRELKMRSRNDGNQVKQKGVILSTTDIDSLFHPANGSMKSQEWQIGFILPSTKIHFISILLSFLLSVPSNTTGQFGNFKCAILVPTP
jgi:hypothetical protein